ncbi:slit homolog 3 protein-like [Chironomus tepperi]|uniref:slit homolog 3 protein-like n=1 Tax=Chironomus tepperi TaxID=113505 RepID=UPI00391FA081
MSRSPIAVLSVIILIISTSYSIELQCKKWRKEICFNSNIIIKDKGTTIQPQTNYRISGISTLFLNEAIVHVLPANLSDAFPNLEILKIVNSSLSEINKADFMDLVKIVEINFELNLISNLPVDALQHLENLSKINLNHNKISSIPSKFFANNLKLTEISVVGNQIEQLHDQTFKNLVNLRYLLLSDNNIVDLRDGTFDDCVDLEVISISNNKLNYAPKSIFDSNKKLIFLKKNFIKNKCIDSYFMENGMTSIDDLKDAFEENCKPYNQPYIDELKAKIEELEKDAKNLTKELKNANKNLEKSNKELTDKAQDFEDLQDVKNQMDATVAAQNDEISNLTSKIDNLTQNYNNLLSSSSKCQSDLKAQISHNSNIDSKLTSCTERFNDCKDYQDRTLKEIGNNTVKIHNLESINKNLTAELDILRSQIADNDSMTADDTLKSLMTAFKEANKKVEALSNKSCNVKSITPIAVPEHVSSFNIDCKFDDNYFRNDKFYTCGINEVRALDCNVKLKEIAGNSNGKEVTGISFMDSYFIDFPTELTQKFTNFKFFKVTKSGFGKFDENICKLSSDIEVLTVTSSIIGYTIRLDDCTALKTLQIETSGIKVITAANPIETLLNIALKGNKIEEITKDFFSKFQNLQTVQMSDNRITHLNGDIFDENSMLETVNLSKNPIMSINGEIFTQNSKLANVDFGQLKCISKAEHKKNKMRDFRRDVLSKCS